MSREAPDLQHVLAQLARFEEHAGRLPFAVAAKVRAVLGLQIAQLGGVVPDTVDPTAHPLHRAAEVRARAESSADEMAELAPVPQVPELPVAQAEQPVDHDFDFDRGATSAIIDELHQTPSRAPLIDVENPRFEDLSQYDLEPLAGALAGMPLGNGERTDGGSLAFHLDDVPVPEEPDDLADATRRPRLVVHAGTDNEEVLNLDSEDEISLGRGKTCTIRLKDARASRFHCRVFVDSDHWAVEDLGSANGTMVNGEFLAPRAPRALSGGEEVVVGSSVLRFEVPVSIA